MVGFRYLVQSTLGYIVGYQGILVPNSAQLLKSRMPETSVGLNLDD
jgi:hypothetical protein